MPQTSVLSVEPPLFSLQAYAYDLFAAGTQLFYLVLIVRALPTFADYWVDCGGPSANECYVEVNYNEFPSCGAAQSALGSDGIAASFVSGGGVAGSTPGCCCCLFLASASCSDMRSYFASGSEYGSLRSSQSCLGDTQPLAQCTGTGLPATFRICLRPHLTNSKEILLQAQNQDPSRRNSWRGRWRDCWTGTHCSPLLCMLTAPAHAQVHYTGGTNRCWRGGSQNT